MKNFIIMSAVSAGMLISGCGNHSVKSGDDSIKADTSMPENSKILIAYYSATGTTAKAAEKIADAVDGVLYEITPEHPYSDADLDYENEKSRSAVENNNPEMRPAIKLGLDIAPYDTVYLGFPVWWDKAPLVIYTFLDSYDFSDKKIVVFATAHSSGLVPSFEKLKAAYPQYDITAGEILNVSSKDTFDSWIKSLGEKPSEN